ncbi:MAG: MATE family efflux transporter [Bacillota bacterium]|nr:MATE family efflux transporter [Bacillota bacterium]
MKNNSKKDLNLINLTWPIFVETFLYMLLGNVDTLMLSRYSGDAVAAVGVSNQLMNMMIIMFAIISVGTSILSAQYLGAGRKKDASKVTLVSLLVNLLFGIILSIVMLIFSHTLLRLMNLPENLMGYGTQFLSIVGGTLVIQALLMTITAIVRSHGHTKISMYISIGMNILNIIGNYILIFGHLGFSPMGVRGSATSTSISRVIGLIILTVILFAKIEKDISMKLLSPFPTYILRNLFRIGIPSAGEQISYSLSQIAVTYFVSSLGTQALTTRVYVQNIVMFVYLFAVAIGQGTSILVGHLVGANDNDEAYHNCFRSLKYALVISLAIGTIFAIFRVPLLHIFTMDKEIIALGGIILIIDLILEPGRATNLVVIGSLKAAGDVKFPVSMGILSMWGISVVLSYLLGIKFGFGLIGIWIASASDEWFRGIFMIWRWKTKRWEKMSFVKAS